MLAKHQGRCAYCNAEASQVHHLRYDWGWANRTVWWVLSIVAGLVALALIF